MLPTIAFLIAVLQLAIVSAVFAATSQTPEASSLFVEDEAIEAVDLYHLRSISNPKLRELRIWIGEGAAVPHEAWRILIQGNETSGQLILYWNLGSKHAGREWRRDVRRDVPRWCDGGKRKGRTVACFYELPEPADWSTILERLESAGIWLLPDESALPADESDVLVFDGWSLTVEVYNGAIYRLYHYGNPDRCDLPEALQAVQIKRILHELGPFQRY